MHNKFKLRISRIFHNSCKSRDDVVPYYDVLEKSPFLSPSPSPLPPPRPWPLSRPSVCKPRTPPSLYINNACIISFKEARSFVPPTRKNRVSTQKSMSRSRSKSTVARFSHFAYNPFYDSGGSRYSAVKDDRGKNRKNKGKAKAAMIDDNREFYSSDDEREDDEDDEGERTADTLFSSRSLSSSESSENRRRMRTRNRASRRRGAAVADGVEGLRGSLAVVKKSRDPYGDFRKSMAEMIIERQIFGEKELHQLLLCFLSLNSSDHHNIILHVFDDIRDALFSM